MELMTVEEVAVYLKINPEVVRRWLREKRLPGVKVGKAWRINKEEIDKILGQSK